MQVLLFHKAWADGTNPAIRTLQHRHTSGSLPSSLFLTNYLPSHPHSPESQLLFEEMGHFWDWFFLIHEMPHSHVHRCTRAVWAFARLSLLCCAAFPFVLQVRTWPRSLLLCFFFFNISIQHLPLDALYCFFLSTGSWKTAAKDKLRMNI